MVEYLASAWSETGTAKVPSETPEPCACAGPRYQIKNLQIIRHCRHLAGDIDHGILQQGGSSFRHLRQMTNSFSPKEELTEPADKKSELLGRFYGRKYSPNVHNESLKMPSTSFQVFANRCYVLRTTSTTPWSLPKA
jgi:hypothetical protein